jgi:hypothetical protein
MFLSNINSLSEILADKNSQPSHLSQYREKAEILTSILIRSVGKDGIGHPMQYRYYARYFVNQLNIRNST